MFLLLALLAFPITRAADAPALPYTQNFEKLAEGEPPEEIQILDGEFVIKKVDGNMLLEMGPDPLKPSGILVGPADKNEYQVTARIKTTSTGKRFNEFGIGACGPNQFKLWLMPATGELQILNGDDVEAKTPYRWESGTWTKFKLSVTKIDGMKYKIQGKAWPEGKDEPKEWLVSYDSTEAPRPGRASLWSTPYAGTATQFDDVVVEAVGK